MAPPAIYGILQTVESLAPSGPKVTLYWDTNTPYHLMPPPTRNFIDLISSMQTHPQKEGSDPPFCIEHVELAIRAHHKDGITGYNQEDLLEKGVEVLSPYDPSKIELFYKYTTRLNVHNSGKDAATQLAVTFPEEVYFEVWGNGPSSDPVVPIQKAGELLIQSLSPNHWMTITIWHNQPYYQDYSPFAAVFDGGTADVIQRSQTIDTSSVHFSLKKRTLEVFVWIFIFSIVLTIVTGLARKKSRLARPS